MDFVQPWVREHIQKGSGRVKDYRNHTLGWGHSLYLHIVNENGWLIHASGHGMGILRGDILVVSGKESDLLYRVKKIQYERDPPDMWSATLMKEVPMEDGTVVTGEHGKKVLSKPRRPWPSVMWFGWVARRLKGEEQQA